MARKKKPKHDSEYKRDPITPIRFTPEDRKRIAELKRKHPELKTTADVIRYKLHS